MNLDQLKTFRQIARLGSFSEVARQLAISQPAVSFQVQKLEQELGLRLIDRTQRAITLTAAGQRLLRFAESLEKDYAGLLQDLEQLREAISGNLLIAASTIPAEFLLPLLLARFKRRHPAVHIQVDVSDSLTVIEKVRDNTYEIGFCGTPPRGQDLTTFRLASDELTLICFPTHPFARKGEIGPDELEGEPFIFRETTSGTQRSLEDLLAKASLDIKKLKPQLVLGSTRAVVAAVAAGAGIAFVSSLAVPKGVSPAPVVPVAVRGLKLGRDFYGVYRQERVVSRLLTAFIDFIRGEAGPRDRGA
jgi:DNA-binding transcriptional LysR family regulator